VIDGWRLLFLRALDYDRVTSRVIHGQVVSGQLAPGPRGRGNVLTPVKTCGMYEAGRPWVPPS
jgi:hypothetical protein